MIPLVLLLFALSDLSGQQMLNAPATSVVLQQARAHARQFQLAEAEAVLEEALERHPADASRDQALLRKDLGWVMHLQGRLNDARQEYLRALSHFERHFGPNQPAVAAALNSLTRVYLDLGNLEQAEETSDRALRLTRHGPNQPLLAVALNNRAEVLRRTGRAALAEALYLESLNTVSTAARPELRGIALNNLATLYADTGRAESALEAYREAVGLWRENAGPRHPMYGQGLVNLATVFTELGALEDAQSNFAEALAILEAALGEDHVVVGNTLANYAHLLRKRGDDRAAKRMERRAKDILREHRKENLLNHTVGLNELAR